LIKKHPKLIVNKISIQGDELKLETPMPEPVVSELSSFLEKTGQTIKLLHVSRPSIGEVFEELTKL